MTCQHCGKKFENGKVCPFCGTAYQGVSLSQLTGNGAKKAKKKMPAKKKAIMIIAIVLAAIILLFGGAYAYIMGLFGKAQREGDLSGDIGVNEFLPKDDVKNIVLYGLDTRQDNDSGRSDAIVVLSLDRKHNKIKMTSIARDTYVAIEGRANDKLTHAWAYGKQQLAVKTLNQNFKLNVEDYVYVNFFEFAKIIDFVGGVDIDVDADEKNVMNTKYTPYIREYGIDCPDITVTGMQHLNGGQALAYSRNRYTGNDVTRGNRQREVLTAMFAQVKDLNPLKFPELISRILSVSHTNLTEDEMMSIALWAVSSAPSMENLSLPTKECNAKSGADAYVNGRWCYIYDLDIATDTLHEFIYETKADAAKEAAEAAEGAE